MDPSDPREVSRPFGFQGGVERGRPLLGAVLPDPVGQRLVHPDRLDRGDPLGIIDQQLTVGQRRVVDGNASHSPTWPLARRRPCHQSIYRPLPSHEGRGGGGEALGGPDVMATACTLGLMSLFCHQMGATAEPRVRPVAPM